MRIACVPATSRRLLFCSRRPGSRGEGDIYVSFQREDGSWVPPRNLGPETSPVPTSP